MFAHSFGFSFEGDPMDGEINRLALANWLSNEVEFPPGVTFTGKDMIPNDLTTPESVIDFIKNEIGITYFDVDELLRENASLDAVANSQSMLNTEIGGFLFERFSGGDPEEPLVLQIQNGSNAGMRVTLRFAPMNLNAVGLGNFYDDWRNAILDFRTYEYIDVPDPTADPTGPPVFITKRVYSEDIPGSRRALSSLLTPLAEAIGKVSSLRADLGAAQNRLEHTISNLRAGSENLSAARSRIQDADIAHSMREYSTADILTQAGFAMLAQANLAPQGVLELLQ